MRKEFLLVLAAAFAGAAFGFTPTAHTNVTTRAGVTYVQRGALGAADYVATNVAQTAADVNALPNNEAQLLANAAFTNAVRAIGGGGGGGGTDVSTVNTLIRSYITTNAVTTNLTGRLDAKRGITDLAVYATDWNFAPFEAVNNGCTYKIVVEDGEYFVQARPKTSPTPFYVCTLTGAISTIYGIGYHVDQILRQDFASCAGVDIFKNGIGATSDTLAKYSEVTNAVSDATYAITNAITNLVTGVNVLHFNGSPATTFVESTATVIEYVMSGKPLFCNYNNLWARYESITPVEIEGYEYYYLSFVCNNPSAYANGVASPLVITCALNPTYNFHSVFAGTYALLKDNLSALTNSANFKAAVETFIPQISDAVVTNLYGADKTSIIDGDRKVYKKIPFSVWTNNTAGAGGIIPAGLQFMPQADSLDVDFVWKATKGSDTYLLVEDRQSGGMSDFRLLKNGETPFPQASIYVSSSSTVLNFNTFKLYKYGSGDTVINTDSLALGSFVSNVNSKVETRTTRTYISQVLGDGTIGRSGLLGLYNGDSYYVNWPFSFGYWSGVVYPNVKSWVGSNYVPQTRKINGQALSTDITINPMDYQAMTNTVNAVKEQFYDQPLQVNWTMRMVNGEMKLYATTNVNMSVLQ